MANIARQVQNGAPQDPLHPLVPSSYTEALDSVRIFTIVPNALDQSLQVRLAETFLAIAESLRKPRGSLLRV
ncbi:hypothetical protein JAAARDRAFT_27866 [Jaapia argillacea MUCL 33604]|uniref:Uncharacterized protein n=1 Tax=Jaapia argillacea MUCL 33604 TaxID=933084 RepID=A0A067QNL9_9AGAM|nr:hypothetical protein JAAARDRAFT_27866 [Jaapia argillacea MUCL 33604]